MLILIMMRFTCYTAFVDLENEVKIKIPIVFGS